MKRISLFEFEDFPWLPRFIRTGVTNLLAVLHRLMGTSAVLSDLLLEARKNVHFQCVADLGSGSGGPMPEAIAMLNANITGEPVSLILTDKYPNPETLEKFNKAHDIHIRYQAAPLDARDIDKAPEGLKTMIASFHHMNPETARAILHNASRTRQPLLIYELAQNSIPTLIWWILLPISLCILFIMTWFMTPMVRPLTWKQLVFTYLIPVIPLVYSWDGQASLVRTYTFKDIETLLDGDRDESYTWKMEVARKKNGKSAGYYLFGYPIEPKV